LDSGARNETIMRGDTRLLLDAELLPEACSFVLAYHSLPVSGDMDRPSTMESLNQLDRVGVGWDRL
jgi:hypothetical protein